MALDDIVQLSITTNTQSPSRLGFGTPLLMACHSVTPNVTELVKSPKEVTDLGFGAVHPVTIATNKIFSQNPRPSQIVIGKRANQYTQIVHLIPVKTTQGYKYAFTFVDDVGVSTAIEYVVPGAATVATICTALVALLDPLTDVVATTATTHVILTGVAGKLFNVKDLPGISDLKVKDVTTDPGIAADLSAVEAIDADTWYCVHLDHSSEAEINAAAAWVEARRKLMVVNTSDWDCTDQATTTDIMSDLKAANYARTSVLFSQVETQSYSAAAWAASMLPTDPGAGTWAYKNLNGVTRDRLTGAQMNQIHAKRGNTYTTTAGLNGTQKGTTSSGEYVDVTHFVDWLYARIQERVFGAIAAASARGSKIPYTDGGVAIIVSMVDAQLREGITRGGLAADPPFTITYPKVADIDPATKGARLLPDIKFQATLAGAIHAVKIDGVLSL